MQCFSPCVIYSKNFQAHEFWIHISVKINELEFIQAKKLGFNIFWMNDKLFHIPEWAIMNGQQDLQNEWYGIGTFVEKQYMPSFHMDEVPYTVLKLYELAYIWLVLKHPFARSET